MTDKQLPRTVTLSGIPTDDSLWDRLQALVYPDGGGGEPPRLVVASLERDRVRGTARAVLHVQRGDARREP